MLKVFDFEKTPVVELVNEILIDATKRGASDIHFDPHEEFIKTRIRIDGELIEYTEIPIAMAKNIVTRIKIISGMNITESRLPQDGAIKQNLEGIDLDMRVSAIPTNKGEKIVIRILDYSLSMAGLENLGFSQSNFKKVLKMIAAPNGIILVTGATGSGKSTTVYSLLQRLNKETANIITVEDPIEMDIDGVNQIQTNSEIGLDFATVLRSILRQDPNIIMIGEIRDTETAKIAVRASITGHLVLSTIHTNDSLNTIERLLDMDVERYLLASALTGIISQKLARKLCPHCRKLRPTNEYEKGIIKKVTGKVVDEIYTTVGCDKCKNGYTGRIAIHEVLLINQDIKDAISSNIRKDKLRHLVYSSDVISLLQDGITKVLDGQTTLEELLKIIELDDDESMRSTGLNNAIDANEITKETESQHYNSNDIEASDESNTEDTLEDIKEPEEIKAVQADDANNIDKVNEMEEDSVDKNIDVLKNKSDEMVDKILNIDNQVSNMNAEEEPINKITDTEKEDTLSQDNSSTQANEKDTTSLVTDNNEVTNKTEKRSHTSFFASKKNIFK